MQSSQRIFITDLWLKHVLRIYMTNCITFTFPVTQGPITLVCNNIHVLFWGLCFKHKGRTWSKWHQKKKQMVADYSVHFKLLLNLPWCHDISLWTTSFKQNVFWLKQMQLGERDLNSFFFQGVLKLARNLVLCLWNTRPQTLSIPHTHPFTHQYKQHTVTERKTLFKWLYRKHWDHVSLKTYHIVCLFGGKTLRPNSSSGNHFTEPSYNLQFVRYV